MIKTIIDLRKELERLEDAGYGYLPIYVEDAQEDFWIDSVQANTTLGMPGAPEPDYFFLMAGGRIEDDE